MTPVKVRKGCKALSRIEKIEVSVASWLLRPSQPLRYLLSYGGGGLGRSRALSEKSDAEHSRAEQPLADSAKDRRGEVGLVAVAALESLLSAVGRSWSA